jgi:hypothetical protein
MAKNVADKKDLDMDSGHIYNSDLLMKVHFPPYPKPDEADIRNMEYKNIRPLNVYVPPRIKIYNKDGWGLQNLRSYYRASIKGPSSLKLYHASILLRESESALKYVGFNKKVKNKTNDEMKVSWRTPYNLAMVPCHINRGLSPLGLGYEDIRVVSFDSVYLSPRTSALEYIQGLPKLEWVYEPESKRLWRRIKNASKLRDWLSATLKKIRCRKFLFCPRIIIISIICNVEILP